MKMNKTINIPKIKKDYPLHNELDGWYFRVTEISNGYFRVEGVDLFGKTVSRTGMNDVELLSNCIEDAKYVISQTLLKDQHKQNCNSNFYNYSKTKK